ncbi:hypothetical protein ACD661_01370 [Legionella lytica]|uniref:Uncharacterized protein n=1 Tax=Legionella lytica TaxID=96232 RepID=A0ABW8D3C6_9GAMM
MDKYKLSTLISSLLFAITVNASQLEAQELCVRKTVSPCMEKCQKTKIINCASTCTQTAHNQCRQAGE